MENRWKKPFSRCYVEEAALGYPLTARILDKLGLEPSPIRHYKDLFDRPNQDFPAQKQSPQLILAVRRDHFFYPGSANCDSFGHARFFYSTLMMNCPYDCEYCYLQGLYPSANVAVFVNTEDYLAHLPEPPAYVALSYDSDLLALERLTGIAGIWLRAAARQPGLELELRTKSANFAAISHVPPPPNVTLAWSLSPEEVIAELEHGTPSLQARLANAGEAIDRGWKVRLCFDPMIWSADWRQRYERLAQTVGQKVPAGAEVSVGCFRLPAGCWKKMERMRHGSRIWVYPGMVRGEYVGYREEDEREMTETMKGWISQYYCG